MAVEQLSPESVPSGQGRSELWFPKYSLLDCIDVPKAIYQQGGGACNLDHLASFLEYKSVNNGAFVSKVGSAKGLGLIQKSGNLLQPTALAHRILSPVYPEDAKKALVEAFFNAALFKRIYEDFKNRELPPPAGLKNAMRTQYGIISSRVDLAFRVMMESAETAGFFATRAGAKTHLIVPMNYGGATAPTPSTPEPQQESPEFPQSGNAASSPPIAAPAAAFAPAPAPVTTALADVKAQYLSTLVKALEAKAEKGEMDEKLMERIERLLGVQ